MLGVGWTEMLVIGVLALIVIGPKDLPAVMNRVGKFAGTIRRMGSEFQRELNKTTGLNEIRNLRSSITQPLKATTDAIRKEFNTIGPDGKETPSGVIKPSDPSKESVVDEIKARAGMSNATSEPQMTPTVKAADAGPSAEVKAPRKTGATRSKAAAAKPAKEPVVASPADAPVKAAPAKSGPTKAAATNSTKAAATKASPAKPRATKAKTAQADVVETSKPAPKPRATRTAKAASAPEDATPPKATRTRKAQTSTSTGSDAEPVKAPRKRASSTKKA